MCSEVNDETIENEMTSPQGPALEKSLEGLFSKAEEIIADRYR